MGKIVEASGMVILTRGVPQQVLLLQHADRWDLPKGHVEPGEDLLSAALRETQEETGIAPELVDVDDFFRFVVEYPLRSAKRGKYTKRVTYFLGTIESVVPIHLTEHLGFRWLNWPLEDSIQKKTIDPLLNYLRGHLSQKVEG